MSRVKNSPTTRARRKKWLKRAKGSFGKRKNCYKIAKATAIKGLVYAYRDRKKRKSDFRRLWITRINIACREHGVSYSKFMNGLKKASILLDRKQLSELAIQEPNAFKKLVEITQNI